MQTVQRFLEMIRFSHTLFALPFVLFNCPSDPTVQPGVDPVMKYARSSYAANYLVFGNVDANFANANAQGKPRLAVSFQDGGSVRQDAHIFFG